MQITFCINRKASRQYCTILVYHSVLDSDATRFKQQMHILKKVSTPIPINYDGPFNSRVNYTIITFDDAFRSISRNALPEMKKLKIPFTIFIPSGYLGKKPDWLEQNGGINEDETICSLNELLEFPIDMVTFGSHTVNHNNLIELNYDQAYYELRESKKALESKFKREIKYLAFPHGAYNSKVIEYCYKTGYKQVFTISPESPITPLRSFIKGRIIVRPSDWKIEFILKALGAYGWKSRAIRKRSRKQNSVQ